MECVSQETCQPWYVEEIPGHEGLIVPNAILTIGVRLQSDCFFVFQIVHLHSLSLHCFLLLI